MAEHRILKTEGATVLSNITGDVVVLTLRAPSLETVSDMASSAIFSVDHKSSESQEI